MPTVARQTFTVSIVVATVVIAAQNFALQHLDIVKTILPNRWLALGLAAGITGVLYRFAMEFYKWRAWRWFNGESVLAGKWEHKLTPTDRKPNNDRTGRFEVRQTPFEISIVCGENDDAITGSKSRWKSLAVSDDELANRRLWIIYEIVRGGETLVAGEAETDRGLLQVDLGMDKRGRRITTMSGTYWDAGRSQHKGSFQAWRADTKTPDGVIAATARPTQPIA